MHTQFTNCLVPVNAIQIKSRCMSVYIHLYILTYSPITSVFLFECVSVYVLVESIFSILAAYKLLVVSCNSYCCCTLAGKCNLVCLFLFVFSSNSVCYLFSSHCYFCFWNFVNTFRGNIAITLKYINNGVDLCLLSFCAVIYLLCCLCRNVDTVWAPIG